MADRFLTKRGKKAGVNTNLFLLAKNDIGVRILNLEYTCKVLCDINGYFSLELMTKNQNYSVQ